MTFATATPPTPASSSRSPRGLPAVSVETLALLTSAFFTIFCNRAAWQHVLSDRSWGEPATWGFAACVLVALTAFQFMLLALVMTRRSARWVATALLLMSAFAGHFIETYNVYLDPGMLRNVLHTDVKEARELLSLDLAIRLAWQAAFRSGWSGACR